MKISLKLLLAFALWSGGAAETRSQPAPKSTSPELVAIYFPGYHQDDHYDSWFGEGWNEWRLLQEAPARFPGHRIWKSAWGAFDEADPKWMEKQISLAADHGIDVFLFDWYWYSGVKILHRPLEQGFLHAANRNRLKFALMWANHDWRNYFPAPQKNEAALLLPSRTSEHDFSRLIDHCATSYFLHTNYWRVEGALYFGVFETDKLIQQLGGPVGTKRALDAARQRTRSAGLGSIHFAAFHSAPEAIQGLHDSGFDSITTYNITGSGKASLPERPLDSYTDVVNAHVDFWKRLDTGVLPYFPVLTVGWDCTPRWERNTPWPPSRHAYPYGTVVISNSPPEFARLCKLASQRVRESHLKPTAILVNAWNEWTEGSALLPEVTHQTGFLEALHQLKTQPMAR